jgi:hypothetical protein
MPDVHYERKSKAIMPPDVWVAIKMSRTPSAKARAIEWRDTECMGLTLRITKSSEAAWWIRRRDRTIKIGRCEEVPVCTEKLKLGRSDDKVRQGSDLR